MSADKNFKRPYVIESYDPSWPAMFQRIKEDVRKVFGAKASAIEHVGSTSVPGMAAKPVIDTLVIVREMEPFIAEKEAMLKFGYDWSENYIAPDTLIFYKTNEDGAKTENVHVCAEKSDQIPKFIHTRDYLRAHPDKVSEYNALKEKLNAEFPEDYPSYRAGKKDFLDELQSMATDWKNKKA